LYYQVTTWATAIRDINIKSVTAPVYDLLGRRVSQPTKHGIYVKGGRKYVK
jgi:PhoPQ-activated pathogenicity-related protein